MIIAITMTDPAPRHHYLKIWTSAVLRLSLFAVALLWPAGSWNWWEAWVTIGLWTSYGLVMTQYLIHRDPDLLAERLRPVPIHKDQKAWDKALMAMFFVFGVSLYIVPGFDVVRYGWSESLPLWIKLIAMLIHIPCFIGLGWVMRENTFLAQVVKIDEERGHQVITSGPYALVRHPMYTVVIVLLFAVPVALGSKIAPCMLNWKAMWSMPKRPAIVYYRVSGNL
jgi:protein-S-isoprenylcysteine O-methyltransferase Ste14